MAVIQIKRRTSAGTGPIVGTAGTIKAGEPLIDLNGTNLYISKADKTGSSANPLTSNDYIEFASKANAEATMDSKISALGLGTASKKNTGTTNGTVPLIGADGSGNHPSFAILADSKEAFKKLGIDFIITDLSNPTTLFEKMENAWEKTNLKIDKLYNAYFMYDYKMNNNKTIIEEFTNENRLILNKV